MVFKKSDFFNRGTLDSGWVIIQKLENRFFVFLLFKFVESAKFIGQMWFAAVAAYRNFSLWNQRFGWVSNRTKASRPSW
jgi:hypothetical protein